jgi:hypothetical protein
MVRIGKNLPRVRIVAPILGLSVIACSSNNTPAAGSGAASGIADGSAPDAASCSTPGMAAPGSADTHCAGPDGGLMVTTVVPGTCDAGGGDDGGATDQCPYGDTMYGQTGDDDDCKYHVTWSATPICEGSSPTIFKVTATYLGTSPPRPLTGAATFAEVITTTPLDAGADASYCDDKSMHIDVRNTEPTMVEDPPGTYTGPVYFNQAGQWTVRFHFNGTCGDLPGSPHGHAAFHITVP